MSESIHIRRGTVEDVEVLADLGEQTFRETFASQNTPADMKAYVERAFAPAKIRGELEDPASVFLLAFGAVDRAPIGYAGMRAGAPALLATGPRPIELRRLYARRDALGKGVGAALMGACLEEAAEGGYETVWLGVWEHNLRALAFYRRWGFETVGSHSFSLGSDEQTDLIMVRPDPGPVG
jgi:ribosomal protein S18 acetylase RimI-like enzyme